MIVKLVHVNSFSEIFYTQSLHDLRVDDVVAIISD
jgi:hypothetical protein